MVEPKIIALDLTGCKYLGEIHLRIREAFDFPEWYGQNWDAFWDLLSEPDDYTIVEVKGLRDLPEELRPSGEMMIRLMEKNRLKQEDFIKKNPQFDYRFEYRIIG